MDRGQLFRRLQPAPGPPSEQSGLQVRLVVGLKPPRHVVVERSLCVLASSLHLASRWQWFPDPSPSSSLSSHHNVTKAPPYVTPAIYSQPREVIPLTHLPFHRRGVFPFPASRVHISLHPCPHPTLSPAHLAHGDVVSSPIGHFGSCSHLP